MKRQHKKNRVTLFFSFTRLNASLYIFGTLFFSRRTTTTQQFFFIVIIIKLTIPRNKKKKREQHNIKINFAVEYYKKKSCCSCRLKATKLGK
jgi:hypothetical protein